MIWRILQNLVFLRSNSKIIEPFKQKMKREKQIMTVYEAPKVEIIEVEVEKGFAASDGAVGEGDDIYIQYVELLF